MVMQQANVRGVCLAANEFCAVGGNPVLCHTCSVHGCVNMKNATAV